MKKACEESQINIGLLKFEPTEERFADLGRMVWEVLNRSEQRRKQIYFIDGKKHELHCQEVVIHGT